MSSSSTPLLLKIGLIIGSIRQPRIGDQIARFIASSINQSTASTNKPSYTLHTIDLSHRPLPLFTGPEIPKTITDPTKYTNPRQREWSQEISACHAFIFVTSEYNYGPPASLKNAIDYLANEWQGKPAMIVAYGGHGGANAVSQLTLNLSAFEMKVVGEGVKLPYPGFAWAMEKAFTGADLKLGEDDGVLGDKKGEIVQGFETLVKLAGEGRVPEAVKEG